MPQDETKPTLPQQMEAIYGRADEVSGKRLSLARWTLERFLASRGTQASASIAYYTLFSLFPMLLVLISAMSFFVDFGRSEALVLGIAQEILPASKGIHELVISTLKSVFDLRGEVGLIGLVALLWSASGALTTLTFNIDLAWSKERRPHPLKYRVVGIVILALLYVALLASLILAAVLNALASRPTPVLDLLGIDIDFASPWIARGLSWLVTFVVLFGLYRWVPSFKVPWSAAGWAALAAGIGWQMVNIGFTWYLSSGLAHYELVYGPLTTVIVLMFWFYLSVLIILLGAHFSASIAQRQRESAARSAAVTAR